VDSGVSNVFVGGTGEREAGKSSLAPLPVHRRFLRPAFSRANSPGTRDERGGRARHVYSRRRAADTHAACKIAAAGKKKREKKEAARRKRPISHLWACEFPADRFREIALSRRPSWEKAGFYGFIVPPAGSALQLSSPSRTDGSMENASDALNRVAHLREMHRPRIYVCAHRAGSDGRLKIFGFDALDRSAGPRDRPEDQRDARGKALCVMRLKDQKIRGVSSA